MQFFGLIDVIRSYCEANSITFIYGNDAYANALADPKYYASNELILVADFSAVPTIESGTVTKCKYNGIISLGQKREAAKTESSLNETPIQKYDRRLKYLSTRLAAIVGELSCNNGLEVSGMNIKFDLNKFDLNADFSASTITLEH